MKILINTRKEAFIMYDELREFIETLFEDVPKSSKNVELKEEILQNLCDKYDDLIKEGKSERAAYNIAVASIGNINELLESEPLFKEEKTKKSAEFEKERQKSALLVSSAVMLYILCVVPILILQSLFGIILMFVFIATATGLIIYNGMTKSKYIKHSESVVEDFKEWQSLSREKKSLINAVNSAIGAISLVIYLVISFSTGAWHITWVVFLIMSAVQSLAKTIIEIKK